MANQLYHFDTMQEGAEIVVKIFNDRGREGCLYYRTRLFASGPSRPLFVTTTEYVPSQFEILVGRYTPPIKVEQVVSDIEAALLKAKEPKKDPAAVELGRRGGLVGGAARAEALPPERRSEIASQAAQARWGEGKAADQPQQQPKKRGRPVGWKPKQKPTGKISREEFIEKYCKRNGTTWEVLSKSNFVAECYCGADECLGWAVAPKGATVAETEKTAPADIAKGLQEWHEKLSAEEMLLAEEVATKTARLKDVRRKLEAIETIRKLSAEVMNED